MTRQWGRSSAPYPYHRMVGTDFGPQRVTCGETVDVRDVIHCEFANARPCIGTTCPTCDAVPRTRRETEPTVKITVPTSAEIADESGERWAAAAGGER